MKKIISCICMVALVLSISCSAFAWQTPTNATWFTINNVQCVNTTTLQYWDYNSLSDPINHLPYKSAVNGFYGPQVDASKRWYVYHTVTGGGGNSYTNLFHAVRLDSGCYMPIQGGTLCG